MNRGEILFIPTNVFKDEVLKDEKKGIVTPIGKLPDNIFDNNRELDALEHMKQHLNT
jgi:hypothetical protein